MNYREFLKSLSTAPDNILDVSWRPKIEEHLSEVTTEGQDIDLLRNIQDAIVAFAHGSDFSVIMMREVLVEAPKESEEDQKARRLEAFPDYAKVMYGEK